MQADIAIDALSLRGLRTTLMRDCLGGEWAKHADPIIMEAAEDLARVLSDRIKDVRPLERVTLSRIELDKLGNLFGAIKQAAPHDSWARSSAVFGADAVRELAGGGSETKPVRVIDKFGADAKHLGHRWVTAMEGDVLFHSFEMRDEFLQELGVGVGDELHMKIPGGVVIDIIDHIGSVRNGWRPLRVKPQQPAGPGK